MNLIVDLKENSYPIYIENHLLDHFRHLAPVHQKGVLLTDSGIPQQWIDKVLNQWPTLQVICIPQGEQSKSFHTLEMVLQTMADFHLTRKDCLVAVGGGVCGDLGGLAASLYMRGIDFYNFPTTLLAQVDSSVGGKTAINLGSIKNLVGTFYQPKAVFIDPNVLSTLDQRQITAGLAEALKMGLILDSSFIDEFEKSPLNLQKIIERSIDLKRQVVQKDEKEGSWRAILNFGHTIGHGLEASFLDHTYYHGECVAAGMLYFIEDPALRKRIIQIQNTLHFPKIQVSSFSQVMDNILHDKKGTDQGIQCVLVAQPGQAFFKTLTPAQLEQRLRKDPYEK